MQMTPNRVPWFAAEKVAPLSDAADRRRWDMGALRVSTLEDLRVVASWLGTQADCRFWAGSRITFPVDLAALPEAIQFAESLPFTLEKDDAPGGFGQLIPKEDGRLHMARLITAPSRRGQGLGRRLASQLLDEARARRAARVSLNVIPENHVAIALYQSLGFRPSTRPSDEPDSLSLYMEHAC